MPKLKLKVSPALKIKPVAKGKLPSASKFNQVVRVANAFLNSVVEKGEPPHFTISDDRAVFRVGESVGSGNVFWNQQQQYTATCPSGSSGNPVTETLEAERVGSPQSVTDANSMALELAQFRATSMLSCDGTINNGANYYVFDAVADPINPGNPLQQHLYLAGQFTNVGGMQRINLCKMKPTLEVHPWAPLITGEDIEFPLLIRRGSIALQPGTTNLFCAGLFDMANNKPLWTSGNSVYPFVKFRVDGSLDTAFRVTGLGELDSVQVMPKLFFMPQGLIYNFMLGLSGPSFARINTTTGAVEVLGQDSAPNVGDGSHMTPVGEKMIAIGSSYYLFGAFAYVRSLIRRGVARFTTGLVHDTSFNPSASCPDGDVSAGFTALLPGYGGGVYDAIQFDGGFLCVGAFTHYHGAARSCIAKISTTGALDSWSPGTGITGPSPIVYSIVQQSDGKIILGGLFSAYRGSTATNLVRINTDGTIDPTFTAATANTNVQIGPAVYRVLLANNSIYIVGAFSHVNGVPRNRIARLSMNGTLL